MPKKGPKLPLIEEVDRMLSPYRALGLNDSMLTAAEMASSLHDSVTENVLKATADMTRFDRAMGLSLVQETLARTDELNRIAAGVNLESSYVDSLVTSFQDSTALRFAEEAMRSTQDMQDLIKPQFDTHTFLQQHSLAMSGIHRSIDEALLARQEMMDSMHSAGMGAYDRAIGVDAFSEVARVREMLEVHDWREEALAAARSMETSEQNAAEREIDQAASYITDHVRRAVFVADESLPTDQAPQQVRVEYLAQMVASLQQSIADMKEAPLSKVGYMIVGAVISTVVSLIITTMLTGSFQPIQPQPRQDHRGRLKAVKASLREQNDNKKPIRVVKVKTNLRVRQAPSPNSRVLHRLPPLAAVVVKDTKGKMALILHRNPMTDEIIVGWVAKKYLAKIDR